MIYGTDPKHFAILNFAVDPDREHSKIKFRAKFNESAKITLLFSSPGCNNLHSCMASVYFYNQCFMCIKHHISIYLFTYRKQIQDINWKRKSEQTEAGAKLKQLEERFVLFSVLSILEMLFFCP